MPELLAELLHGRHNAGPNTGCDEVDDYVLGHAADVSALLWRLPADLYALSLEHPDEAPDESGVALIGDTGFSDTGFGHKSRRLSPDTARQEPGSTIIGNGPPRRVRRMAKMPHPRRSSEGFCGSWRPAGNFPARSDPAMSS